MEQIPADAMCSTHTHGRRATRKLTPHTTKENLVQCTMCTPNTHDVTKCSLINTLWNETQRKLILPHIDTHRFPPSTERKNPNRKRDNNPTGQTIHVHKWPTTQKRNLVGRNPMSTKQSHLHMSYATTRNTDPSSNSNQPISHRLKASTTNNVLSNN